MRLVLKLFILQNVAQISVPVNMCTCHLVAGCMNHDFSTGSSNTFLKENQFFSAKVYNFLKAHRYSTDMILLHGYTLLLQTPKHECNLNIPDILNKRNDGDSEYCKSDKYSNIKSNGVSDSAESNNRYKDGGTMGIFPYR